MTPKNYSRGFTLVETLVVLFIFSLGIVIIFDMFLAQNRLYRTQTAQLNITSSVRFALDDIDNYGRQAHRTLASYSTYTAGPQTLILEIGSVNSSGRLISGTYDHVVYYLTSGSLTRVVIPDASSTRPSSTRVVAVNVTALTFTYNNADYTSVTQVDTSLTCAESASIQTRTYTGSSKTKLRSY
ncbi:MAG: prepilin-type N-terminal cleavage/methylation domain-containing protein [Candidatus Doudnabacteria bacterium]|nr:prepilin-type N-terminal cleavage/methylation domain-containing protein [Candidatus Doudnabacteria bacterium]